MSNKLFETIDKAKYIIADDVPVETKDLYDIVEELETTRVVDYQLTLLHLKDILSFFMNINLTKEINEKICDLLITVVEKIEIYY